MTRKNDNGKARWDLLPWRQIHQVVLALTHGAKEYDDHNWQTVPLPEQRYLAALHRHLFEYVTGVTKDAKSGLHPLAHVVCNALFLLWFANNPPDEPEPGAEASKKTLARDRLWLWLKTVNAPFDTHAAARVAGLSLCVVSDIDDLEDLLEELGCKRDIVWGLWQPPSMLEACEEALAKGRIRLWLARQRTPFTPGKAADVAGLPQNDADARMRLDRLLKDLGCTWLRGSCVWQPPRTP